MDREDMIHMYCGILLGHKKKGILPFFTTWMEFENIMLSEINQTELWDTENRLMGIWGEGGWKVGEMGEGSQLHGDT